MIIFYEGPNFLVDLAEKVFPGVGNTDDTKNTNVENISLEVPFDSFAEILRKECSGVL
jgi:hypothetical protein